MFIKTVFDKEKCLSPREDLSRCMQFSLWKRVRELQVGYFEIQASLAARHSEVKHLIVGLVLFNDIN